MIAIYGYTPPDLRHSGWHHPPYSSLLPVRHRLVIARAGPARVHTVANGRTFAHSDHRTDSPHATGDHDHATRFAHATRDRHFISNANANGDTHRHTDSDRYADGDAHRYTNPNGDANRNAHADGNPDGNAHADRNTHGNANRYGDPN